MTDDANEIADATVTPADMAGALRFDAALRTPLARRMLCRAADIMDRLAASVAERDAEIVEARNLTRMGETLIEFQTAEIQRQAAEIARLKAGGWRPIATAPKDGTEALLYAPIQEYNGTPTDERVTIGHWTTEEECREQIGDCGGECRCPEYKYHDPSWISWDGGFTVENPPTHWQPLPPPPTDTPEDATDA
jgi:hypothetical protein